MPVEVQHRYLTEAGAWRRRCVHILQESRIRSPLYLAAAGIMAAIDGLAEAVTGKRDHFHLTATRTPGTDDAHPPKPKPED